MPKNIARKIFKQTYRVNILFSAFSVIESEKISSHTHIRWLLADTFISETILSICKIIEEEKKNNRGKVSYSLYSLPALIEKLINSPHAEKVISNPITNSSISDCWFLLSDEELISPQISFRRLFEAMQEMMKREDLIFGEIKTLRDKRVAHFEAIANEAMPDIEFGKIKEGASWLHQSICFIDEWCFDSEIQSELLEQHKKAEDTYLKELQSLFKA